MTSEEKRIANAEKLLENVLNPGRHGDVFELMCARKNSKKTTVSAQGRPDVFVAIRLNGKVRYIQAECKTNGGRIDDLLDGTNKSKFVIYRLDVVQKHKACAKRGAWDEVRYVAPVIMKTELFLEMLRRCNAIKTIAHGGVVDGLAIQCSSKALYEMLLDYPIPFDNETVYDMDDFEGLVL